MLLQKTVTVLDLYILLLTSKNQYLVLEINMPECNKILLTFSDKFIKSLQF